MIGLGSDKNNSKLFRKLREIEIGNKPSSNGVLTQLVDGAFHNFVEEKNKDTNNWMRCGVGCTEC